MAIFPASVKNVSLRGVAVIVCALLPFGMAIVNGVAGTSAAPRLQPASKPALAFDQYLVNLGTVPAMDEIYARFRYLNRGQTAVEILELKPSCGCMTPTPDRTRLEPGENGEFLLRVSTANQKPGAQEFTVLMRYTDPEPREAVLVMKATLPEEQVVVRPRSLIFYQFGTQETTQEIVVTDLRSRTLKVTGVRSTTAMIKARLGETTINAQGQPETHIEVTVAANVPAGVHSAWVTMTTDDSMYPELRVPLRIQGGELRLPQLAEEQKGTETK